MAETIIIRKWNWDYIAKITLALLFACGVSIGIYFMMMPDAYELENKISDYGGGIFSGIMISMWWACIIIVLCDFRERLYERIELCKQTRRMK
jgi:hypothetical protein